MTTADHKKLNGYYYVDSEGYPQLPTTKDTIELPDAVVVAPSRNSLKWYNRRTVGDWDENGNRQTWDVIDPLVMSANEWARSNTTNFLHTVDPYGKIPWNAAAMSTGLLAGELAAPFFFNMARNTMSAGKSTLASASPRYGKIVNADSTPDVLSEAELLELKKRLPSYAKPNWGGDPLNLTKSRIANGGTERLLEAAKEGTGGFPTYTYTRLNNFYNKENGLKSILSKKPLKGTSDELSRKLGVNIYPSEMGVAIPMREYSQLLDDIPNSLLYNTIHPKNNRALTAHEFSHYVYVPTSSPKGFNFNMGSHINDQYFKRGRGMEIQARGTQLKNYFGLKEGEDITPDMWKYAKQRYVKDTGLDNTMSDFFNRVDTKSPDFPAFLKWINKNSPAVVPVTGSMALSAYNYGQEGREKKKY